MTAIDDVRNEISRLTASLETIIVKTGVLYSEIMRRLSRIDKYRNKELYELYERDLVAYRDFIVQASALKGLLEALDEALVENADVGGLLALLCKYRRTIPEFIWEIEWIIDVIREVKRIDWSCITVQMRGW